MPERRTVQFKAWNARPLIDILSPRHWHLPVRRNSKVIAKFHKATAPCSRASSERRTATSM